MNKRQLIAAIRQFNTTASAQFLQQFEEADLQQYLEHLQGARRHDIRIHGWVRPPRKFRMAS